MGLVRMLRHIEICRGEYRINYARRRSPHLLLLLLRLLLRSRGE